MQFCTAFHCQIVFYLQVSVQADKAAVSVSELLSVDANFSTLVTTKTCSEGLALAVVTQLNCLL